MDLSFKQFRTRITSATGWATSRMSSVGSMSPPSPRITRIYRSKSSNRGRPTTTEELMKLPSLPNNLGKSEDELIRVLNNKDCTVLFLRWCESQHCQENLDFWIECEIARLENEEVKQRKAMDELYEKYFPLSGETVNIDSELLSSLRESRVGEASWDITAFDDIQRHVFLMLSSHTMIGRFMQSSTYSTWREAQEHPPKVSEKKKGFHSFFRRSRTNMTSEIQLPLTDPPHVETLFHMRNEQRSRSAFLDGVTYENEHVCRRATFPFAFLGCYDESPIPYGVAVTSKTLTLEPRVRLPIVREFISRSSLKEIQMGKEGKPVIEKGTGGHVGSIVDGMQFLPSRYFVWQTTVGHNQRKPTRMKISKEPKGSFKQRWVILHYNYIVAYKFGKIKPDFYPKMEDEPDEIICLELSTEQVDASFEKGHTDTFVIHTSIDSYWIECESTAEMESWIQQLRNTIKALQERKREGIEEVTAQIEVIREELPENTKFTSKLEDIKEAAPYTSEMVFYNDIRRKHSAFMNYLNMFAEYQIGRNKAYLTFFIERLRPALNASDEAIMGEWVKEVKRGLKVISNAQETSFFKEDFKSAIDQAELSLKTIDAINLHLKSYHEELNPKYTEEKAAIELGLRRLNSYPSMSENHLKGYASGVMKAKEGKYYEEWKWDQQKGLLTRERCGAIEQADSHEIITFTAQEDKPCWVNPSYGVILWNRRSFIWTHPRCPFIIRFDWSESRKTYKQHFQTVKEDRKAKAKAPAAVSPSIADWAVQGNMMRAVVVGDRATTMPEPPPINLWEVQGNIPPPICGVVANFYAIRVITRAIFGLQN
ncbi:regulator of G-protein signaling 11 [Planoprotostelium fungivorum]|uniref:Regulator of G-protein signaling 11 n=1 Tax=Planoprotostelium fungivorum TaxID=1890364 RepID=A0A2P6MP61_9EUKA|nr:regulator of G-protein signaling 11 [Planoprotostelium fungivorum]